MTYHSRHMAKPGVPQPAPAADVEDLRAKLSATTTELDKLKERHEGLAKLLAAQTAAQNDRIRDLSIHLAPLGWFFTGIGVLIAAASIASFIFSQDKAANSFQEWLTKSGDAYFKAEAKSAVDKWIQNEGKDRIDELAKSAVESRTAIVDALVESAKKQTDELLERIDAETKNKTDAIIEQYRVNIANYTDDLGKVGAKPPSAEERQQVETVSKQVDTKQENARTFNDWMAKALDAYFKDDFSAAQSLFDQASRTPGATPEEVAKAQYNNGVAWRRLERNSEAVAAFEQVEIVLGSATELASQEQERLAKALVYKGISLDQLKQYEKAVAAYEQVEERFGSATELALREQVARALVYKGISLNQSKQYAKAVAAYEQVEKRFGSATKTALREQVARARANKRAALKLLGQSYGAQQPIGGGR
ncbi:MAG: hypothetical protein H7840_00200 [Alphaproteobacteria bacterium]